MLPFYELLAAEIDAHREPAVYFRGLNPEEDPVQGSFMTNPLRLAAICAVLCVPLLSQQTNAPSPLPPGAPPVPLPTNPEATLAMPATPSAAYQFAMQPVEVVRRSSDNMSDAERYSWTVAVARAAEGCEKSNATDFKSEELYSLAQLCALGEKYPEAITAIKQYLSGADVPQKPELARALWARTALQMADGRQSLRVTEQLIDMYPYDAIVHSVSQDVSMALAGPDEGSAIALAMRRFPALLDAIGTGKPLASPDHDFEVPTAVLFSDALKLAAIYKHRGDTEDADSILQQIAKRLQDVGSQVSQSQHHQIDLAVKHYLMLGQPAPAIQYSRRIPKTQKRVDATLPTKGKTIVLLFYTSWCAQCYKRMTDMPKLAKTYNGKVAAYAVTTPEIFGVKTIRPELIEKSNTAAFKEEIAGVAMLVASDDVRRALQVEDYPMLVIIGPDGTIRYLDELPRDRFAPRGYIDRMLRRLAGMPPPAEPEQRTPRAPSHAD